MTIGRIKFHVAICLATGLLTARAMAQGDPVNPATAAYADAIRKVGADEYITVIDLNQISVAMLKRMTQEQADKFDKGNDSDMGRPMAVAADATSTGVDAPVSAALDRTPLNPYGQKVFGRLVADTIVKTQVELGPDMIGVAGGPTTVQRGGPPGSRPVPVPAQPATRPSGN